MAPSERHFHSEAPVIGHSVENVLAIVFSLTHRSI